MSVSIPAGRINKLFGTDGGVMLSLYADFPADFDTDTPLLVTVLALFGQFKELFIVNYLRWTARHKGMPFPSDAELMRILKKNNVYVLGEIKQNAANWDNRRVFNIPGLLREYDAKKIGRAHV